MAGLSVTEAWLPSISDTVAARKQRCSAIISVTLYFQNTTFFVNILLCRYAAPINPLQVVHLLLRGKS